MNNSAAMQAGEQACCRCLASVMCVQLFVIERPYSTELPCLCTDRSFLAALAFVRRPLPVTMTIAELEALWEGAGCGGPVQGNTSISSSSAGGGSNDSGSGGDSSEGEGDGWGGGAGSSSSSSLASSSWYRLSAVGSMSMWQAGGSLWQAGSSGDAVIDDSSSVSGSPIALPPSSR